MDNESKLNKAYSMIMFGLAFVVLGLWLKFGAVAGLLTLGIILLAIGLGAADNLEQEAEIEEFDREFEEFRKKHGV